MICKNVTFLHPFFIGHFDFSGEICPKNIFPVQNSKSEYHHRIQHIRISLVAKFHLKQRNLIFVTKILFSVWNRMSKHHRIEYICIKLDAKFHVKWEIYIICTKFAQKGYFGSKTERYQIYFKQTILIFWTKLVQEELFRSKTE